MHSAPPLVGSPVRSLVPVCQPPPPRPALSCPSAKESSPLDLGGVGKVFVWATFVRGGPTRRAKEQTTNWTCVRSKKPPLSCVIFCDLFFVIPFSCSLLTCLPAARSSHQLASDREGGIVEETQASEKRTGRGVHCVSCFCAPFWPSSHLLRRRLAPRLLMLSCRRLPLGFSGLGPQRLDSCVLCTVYCVLHGIPTPCQLAMPV